MKLIIVDGNSIINRAYYGIRPLTTHDGMYTNAILGFLNILQKLMHEESPDAVCVAFDLRGPTFRHLKYDGYKATRKGMPDELAMQMPVMKQILQAMKIPIYEIQGYEADDVIGTVGRRCTETGWDCVVITGDRDALQLINEHVTVNLLLTRGGHTASTHYDRDTFTAEYGMEPGQLIDLKSLMGDASDNIPGVPGIGKKTASVLLQEFGTTENLYNNLASPSIKAAVRKKLEAGREMAFLSYDLATICCEVPLDFSPEDCLVQPWDKKTLYDLFMQLEFVKLIDRYELRTAAIEPEPADLLEDETRMAAVLLPASGEDLKPYISAWECADTVCCMALPDLCGVAVHCSGTTSVFLQSRLGEEAFTDLLQCLFSSKIRKIAHAVKELQHMLLQRGISSAEFVFDTELAAYFLNPSAGSYSLEVLSVSALNHELPPASLFTAEGAFDDPDPAAAMEAIAEYLLTVDSLYQIYSEQLAEQGMDTLYFQTDLPLCAVLAEMEYTGVLVDQKALEDFGQMLNGSIEVCQEAIYRYAGGEFNINSPIQLSEVLFDRLQLPPGKKTSRGYSTNIDVLNKLRSTHPIIQEIIDYRTLTKLKATYADGLLKVIAEDGRIHTTFQNTVTATGRLSSTEPNLQNIPIRTELGGQIRKMFIPRAGWVLVDADYSQIELRVLAHIADDEAMRQAFLSGEDIHRVTASQVFGVPPEEVTPEMRRQAKAVNFGIVYGMSEYSLSEDIGVSYADAKAWMCSYFEKYSGVRAWRQQVVETARQNGYVTTLMGRRRSLPELHSSNRNVRSAAERMALNTPIQGSAADIIKAAMLRVDSALKASSLQARLILQVHDELLVEAPADEVSQVQELLTREMTQVCTLSVPLVAEAHTGKNWYDAK